MEEGGDEREQRVGEPGKDATPHGRERRRCSIARSGARDLDRGRDRGRRRNDEPRRERLFVAGAAEEREKADRTQRCGDDGSAGDPRP
jgi:hypothetical protein